AGAPDASSRRLALRTPPFADPFAHARRPTQSCPLRASGGGLLLGGDEPVRVELDRPGALERPAAIAAQLAVELAGLRDVACESRLVPARTAGEAGRLAPLVRELGSLGLSMPISLRIAPPAPADAPAIGAAGLASAREAGWPIARLVVRLEADPPV